MFETNSVGLQFLNDLPSGLYVTLRSQLFKFWFDILICVEKVIV